MNILQNTELYIPKRVDFMLSELHLNKAVFLITKKKKECEEFLRPKSLRTDAQNTSHYSFNKYLLLPSYCESGTVLSSKDKKH